MHIDLATVSVLGALQALLLAPLLLAATRVYAGLARTSLRIWGVVLLLQALGWLLLSLRGQISDSLSILLGNALLMVSYAETTRALRMLLGVPQYRRILAVIGVAGWLGVVWFAQVDPDYRMRVYSVLLSLGIYVSMLLWPLRHALRRGGSMAQRVMLLVLLGACVTWVPRVCGLSAGAGQPGDLLMATPGNIVNLIYGAVEPVLASIGFLLMYNEMAQTELRRLARTDPLTGVLNRMALDEQAHALFLQPAGHGPGCAALMIDADHFKTINDRFGHAGGDGVLATLAAAIAGQLRASDILGRIGGEEFLILLPDTTMDAATALGERLRTVVADLRFELDGEPRTITISVGVAARTPDDRQPGMLIRRADRALYAAKHAGRNRVAAWPGETNGSIRGQDGAGQPD
ncbi:MAG TPA: diguanylate cyclase [Rhodanobacter sp.]